MAKLRPEVAFDNPENVSGGKGSVLVSIDTQQIKYFGFDVNEYKKKALTYRYPSKYTHLLSWLRKNSTSYEELGKQAVKKITPAPAKAKSTQPKEVTIKGAMMLKVAETCLSSGYTMQLKGKSVDTRRCPKCNDSSLLGAYKNKNFVVICFNRYNPDNKKFCGYTKKYIKK
jgi:hypothetical protein